MHIVIATTEYEGIFKNGGLGDAIFGFANAFSKLKDYNVSVIIPHYKNLNDEGFNEIGEFEIKNPDGKIDEDISKLKGKFLYKKLRDVDVYLIKNDHYFYRDTIHNHKDEILKWAFFCRGVYELIIYKDLNPDIICTNDYHEGFVTSIFKANSNDLNCKHVVTIHNAFFRNIYSFDENNPKPLFDYYLGFEWEGNEVDMLQWSVSTADYVLTVSPDYALSIQEPDSEFAAGLDYLYREKNVIGFLNGVDTSIYDRYSDDFDSFMKVKEKSKLELQKRFNLKIDKDIPLFSYICRLGEQKGSPLIYDNLKNITDNGQFILLGTGLEKCNDKFDELNGKLDNYVAIIDFDVELAKNIYLASDFFLMPSWFEPCGIAQLIAIHYATLPIVTNVGGLKDTVINYNLDNANGLKLNNYSGEALTDTIKIAKDIYFNDKELFFKMRKNAYNSDYSWDNAIKNYIKFYEKIIKE